MQSTTTTTRPSASEMRTVSSQLTLFMEYCQLQLDRLERQATRLQQRAALSHDEGTVQAIYQACAALHAQAERYRVAIWLCRTQLVQATREAIKGLNSLPWMRPWAIALETGNFAPVLALEETTGRQR